MTVDDTTHGGDELSRVPRADGRPRRALRSAGGDAMIIAIDGPAASGKGTLAKRIAELLGLPASTPGCSTARWRATLAARGFSSPTPGRRWRWRAASTPRRWTTPACARRAPARRPPSSPACRQVRAALLDYQRAFAAQAGGAVLDGRDIGTVVCPDADAKIYVTARPEVRAWRRFAERQEQGLPSPTRRSWPISSAGTPAMPAAKAPPCGPPPTPTCSKPRTWI